MKWLGRTRADAGQRGSAAASPGEPDARTGERSLVWILGTPDESIADDARATGAFVRRATFDPLAELVLVHRLAMAIAEAKGIDPDHPRHLTRSVVLS